MGKNLKKSPRVTVLMSVYNSEEYLKLAIDSILNQTYNDFEFLIINDGSKDNSLDIIKSYNDPRIRLISRENKGLVASLNEGIEKARGKFIARQDSDDASIPERLAIEVRYLESHPDVGMVGSNYVVMDNKNWSPMTSTNIFTHPKDLKLAQITCNQYGHGSVMMRTDLARNLKGYDPDVGYVEDYDLWTRMSQVSDIANIEKPLYLYRRNEDGITQKNHDLQIKQTFAVRDKAFKYYLKHKGDYSLLFYKPSGNSYKHRKAVMFRDLAYLYLKNNRPFGCLKMITLSIALEPKDKRNIQLIKCIFDKRRFKNWEYEFL